MRQNAQTGLFNPWGGSQAKRLFFAIVFRLNDLLAAVVTVGADVVTEMDFTALGLYSRRGIRKIVVRTMIATSSRGLLILLNCHGITPLL